MTFKEKHLLPLMMSAVMITSCGDVKSPFHNDRKKDNMGLLDERPLKDDDKYGADVVLCPVSIPVYNAEGKRLENQYVLTRGLQESSYESVMNIENMRIKQVYLNGSNQVSYVKADDNNAIYTERGFCGLFIDYNKKAVVVADKNINQFTTNLGIRSINKTINNEQYRNNVRLSNVTDEDLPQVKDTVILGEVKDSVVADTVVNTAADSMKNKSAFNEKQFLDTMQVLRQKEL